MAITIDNLINDRDYYTLQFLKIYIIPKTKLPNGCEHQDTNMIYLQHWAAYRKGPISTALLQNPPAQCSHPRTNHTTKFTKANTIAKYQQTITSWRLLIPEPLRYFEQ